MTTKGNILITGSRSPVALDLARNLSSAGFVVFTADCIKHPLTKFSSSSTKSFKVCSPRDNEEQYITDIVSVCIKEAIQLVIPTCEEIFYISRYKDLFKGISEVFVDDFTKLKTLHNKWEFISLLKSMDIEAPKSWLITDLEGLKNITLRPLILKPVYSRFGSTIHLLKNLEDDFHLIKPSSKSPWVAQEYFEGKVWCSYSVVKEGKVSLHTNYSSDFKVGNGASIYFEHVQKPLIEEWVKTFVSKYHFTGQIAFDFIHTKDNRYIPIECNPRSTSGIHLLTTLPEFSTNFIRCESSSLNPVKGASAILKLPMFIYGLNALCSLSKLKLWFKAMRAKDVIFKWSDPIPSFYQFVTFFEFWKKGIKLGIDPVSASTHDIEYNGDL